jgi:hypothetical protein
VENIQDVTVHYTGRNTQIKQYQKGIMQVGDVTEYEKQHQVQQDYEQEEPGI